MHRVESVSVWRLFSAGVFLMATSALAGTPPETVSLWPGQAPIGDGKFETAKVTLTVHLPPAEKSTGAAIVICPGGGYGGLVTGPEGHGIAEWLVGHGIAGMVLEYRLPHGRPFVPLLDAQRAIRTIGPTPRRGASLPTASASSASPRAGTWPPPRPRTSIPATPRRPTPSARPVAVPTLPF